MRRLHNEQGFTLIELVVVTIIVGILLAIAVPSYLGFKERAQAAKQIPVSCRWDGGSASTQGVDRVVIRRIMASPDAKLSTAACRIGSTPVTVERFVQFHLKTPFNKRGRSAVIIKIAA